MSKKKKTDKEPVIKETTAYVSNNGTLLAEDVHEVIPIGKEPPYFKVYIQDLGNIMGLTPAEQTVFYCLCRSMGWSGLVVLIKIVKDMLVKETGYTFATIKQAIINLTKKGFLIRKARSAYLVNPKYCAKGEWGDIKATRIEIAYSATGRKVTVKRTPRGQSLQIESSTENPHPNLIEDIREEIADAKEIKADESSAEQVRKDFEKGAKPIKTMFTKSYTVEELRKMSSEDFKKLGIAVEQDMFNPNENAQELPFKD